MNRKLRSVTPKVDLINTTYTPLDDFPGSQVPTGKEVMERMMFLTKEVLLGADEAAFKVAIELQNIMIFNLNIYPLASKNIKKKVISDYQEFKKLINYPKSKRSGQSYQSSANSLNIRLETGYAIKTDDPVRQEELTKEHGVQYGEAEEILYEDNTKVKSCLCAKTSVTKCIDCPRQVFSDKAVDKEWLKDVKDKEEALDKENMAKEKSAQDIAKMFSKVASDTIPIPEEPGDAREGGSKGQKNQEEEVFTSPTTFSAYSSPSVTTRLKSSTPSSTSSSSPSSASSISFPKIPVRFGRRTLNPKVMVAAVHVSSKYDISLSATTKIIVDVMNMVCDQEWTVGGDFEEDAEECDVAETIEVENPHKKARKVQHDLTYRFPSRQTLSVWLRDAAILNLKYMADSILNKDVETVVTWGTDDTIKKAGHRVFDSKSNHITVNGPNMEKLTFTTGFDPNLSHKGSDSAFSINTKLKMLAVLTKSSVDDIKAQINFWMGDRADDVTKAFEILEIESGRVLRCSAHISVGADAAINKVFKLFENTVGIQNLITLNAGQTAFISNNSIFTMAIHAISKLLSYSHATLPYSLCVMYKKWRKSEGKEKLDFEDFSSNRFGRTSTLAKRFLQHRDDLIQFFEQCVDENANKLGNIVSLFINLLNSFLFSVGSL